MRRALLAATLALAPFGAGALSGVAGQGAVPCSAPDEWFVDNKTPAVPENFKVPTDDECHFYRFAWQSFLWLTQSDGGGNADPRFVSFKTPNDLFRDKGGEQLQLHVAPARTAGGKKPLALSVRTLPSTGMGNVSAVAIGQAGSQGVVVDRNNRAIYYGIHFNDRLVNFIRNGLKLTTADQIKDVDPAKQFPPGCLELKSSWRVLTEDERKPDSQKKLREKFFIADAMVPTLFTDADGSIKADPKKARQETVALMGLHVAGTIVDHPEFIWASFEHIDNSPILTNQGLPFTQPVDDSRDYTFYRKGTKRLQCNKNPIGSTANPLKLTSDEKQTLEPVVDIFRQFNSGKNGVGEDDDVKNLNDSVHSKLAGQLTVWKNYTLIGAVWLKKPADSFKENRKFADDVLAGEKKLSNSTMETFTQTGQPNCFSCHNTQGILDSETGRTMPPLRINVSHVLTNAYLKR